MKKKLDSIQAYRAFAAILVVLFHCSDATGTYFKTEMFGSFFHFGWIGVDFFFVLSGFIITYIHFNDVKNKTNGTLFLKKRFVRIYPIYWVISAIVLVALLFMKGKTTHSYTVDFQSASGISYLINCFLLVPQSAKFFLSQAWTLSYEVLFYIVFYIAILIGLKKSRFMLAGWLSLILINYFFIQSSNTYLSIALNPIIIEFFIGILTAFLILKGKTISLKTYYPLIIVSTILLYFNHTFDSSATEKRNLLTILILSVIASATIIVLVKAREKKLSLLTKVGESSYTIYLIHTLLLSVYLRFFATLLSKLPYHFSFAAYQFIFALIFVLVIASSYLFHRVVEVPLLAFFNRLILSKNKSANTPHFANKGKKVKRPETNTVLTHM